MRADRLDNRMYAVVFDDGDEAMTGLRRFATDEGLSAASLSAIGGFSQVTLGFFDLAARDYLPIHMDEQVEVLALLGDVTLDDGGAQLVHAHAVVGTADGTARGGHLLEGHVRPTLEVMVNESPGHLRRRHDPATGLQLLAR